MGNWTVGKLLALLLTLALGGALGLWIAGQLPTGSLTTPPAAQDAQEQTQPPLPETPSLSPDPEAVTSEPTTPTTEPSTTEPPVTAPDLSPTPPEESAQPVTPPASEADPEPAPPLASPSPPGEAPSLEPVQEAPPPSPPALEPVSPATPDPAPAEPGTRAPPPQTAETQASLTAQGRTGAQPLTALNSVRALAGLPPVARQSTWEAECVAHARYLALADDAAHSENPQSPYRSAQGEACAPGHYFVSSMAKSAPERALNYWASGAFHLPQLLNPRLTRAAFGVAYDDQGEVLSAAVLDVKRGLSGLARYPVKFPGPGRQSPLTTAASFEWPDPLPGCPGYDGPVGAPLALLLGPQAAPVRSAALKVNGQAVAACLLTAQTFQGGSANDTRVGRGVLASQGAAILLPRKPLPAGASVRVSFRTASGAVSWAFQVRR